MAAIKVNDNEYITLIQCSKNFVKINDVYYLLILGITENNKAIYIRLFANNYFYENLYPNEYEPIKYNTYLKNIMSDNYTIVFEKFRPVCSIFIGYFFILFKRANPLIQIKNSKSIECNFDAEKIREGTTFQLSNSFFNKDDFAELCKNKLKANILNLDNNEISDLCHINSENLQFLNNLVLSRNHIKDLNPLRKIKLDNLKILDLSFNAIKDLNDLEYSKFVNLEILNLKRNDISDISVFEKVKYDNLLKLDLSNNNIIDISPFENTNLGKLNELNLSDNKINNFSSFENITLNSLENLNLSNNKIKKIEIKKKFFLSI